ncbi:MAG TPA: flagellar hook-length control protein FliK [Nevskiaceae bacterium]|nr:flagellar hook-length control protein FliK [Nevskiaceae bacterium]
MAADFIAALAAALPTMKAASTTAAAPTTPAPTATDAAPLPQASVTTPVLPTLAVAAAPQLAAKKPIDLPSALPTAKADPEPSTEAPTASPAITPEIIAAFIAAMVPQSAAPARAAATPVTPATPADGSIADAPATAARRATPATPAIPPTPQAESAIAQALAIVSEKAPEHSAAADVLSALVTNAEAPKPQAAPETIAIATASSFALPSVPPQVDGAQSSAPVPQPRVEIAIPVHVEHPQWGQAVGEQLVMAVHQGRHSAELRLDPPSLGPVSVQIELSGNQAKISFVAPATATCDALAQSLPDLKNAFSAQGMTLAQANVAQEQTQQQAGHDGRPPSLANVHAGEPTEVLPIRIVRPQSLVDEYA